MICAHCQEKPALCVGQYDNMPETLPACDDCCGHANEDGFCDPIEDVLDAEDAEATERRSD